MNNETTTPSNANENCVGPTSSNAGKSSACEGCPNQSQCASGTFSSGAQTSQLDIEHTNIRHALSNVSNVMLVLSGKGGVGKSTVCCQVAHTLASRGFSVGVLDVDICGPSVARMMGVSGQTVHNSGSGWCPVYANPNLAVMSVSFLLQDEDLAVVWRGPRKNGMIKKFLTEVNWAEDNTLLDYLLIDTPPGTSDEHISTVQYLQGALGVSQEAEGEEVTKLGGAIVVTTPEEVAMADVRKELNFCVKTKLPVLGLVENMSLFKMKLQDFSFQKLVSSGVEKSNDENGNANVYDNCTKEVLDTITQKCPELLDVMATARVFPPSGSGPQGMANAFGVPYLGGIPLDPNLLKSCENGLCFTMNFPDSVAASSLDDIVDKVLDALPPVADEDEDINGVKMECS